MRDYTRVYLLGLSVLCLVLLIVVAAVPAHKSYVDTSTANISAQLAANNAQDKQLTSQLSDKVTDLTGKVSDLDSSVTGYSTRLENVITEVSSLHEVIKNVQESQSSILDFTISKADTAQLNDVRNQISGIIANQASIIASIENLYKALHIQPNTGNTTGG